MAFAAAYRTEFTDTHGVHWRVDILDESGDTLVTMQASGDPISFDYPQLSDNIYDQNIRGSQASIGIFSETNFAFSDLFTSDNLEYKVNIYKDTSTLFWAGWITANTWSENYADTPYETTISAVDGLGLLKDFDFSDLSLDSRETFSKVIYDILGTISVTTFTEFVNVYEDQMDSGNDDSPLDQSGCDTILWEDSTMYEALEDILKTFNACIIQVDGVMTVYRYQELEDTTMRGRIFTSATAKSSTTRTPAQYIKRPTQSSNFIDMGQGSMITIPQVRLFTINQDYGNKESWLKNWELAGDTFDGTDFENWTKVGGNNVKSVGDYPTGEKDGMAIIDSASYAYNTFGALAVVSATDVFTLEFEYGYYNTTAATINNLDIKMIVVQGSKSLDEVDVAVVAWTTPATSLAITNNAPIGWSGWSTYKRQFTGIDFNSFLQVNIYGTTSGANCYSCFKNIKIYATSSETAALTSRDYSSLRRVGGNPPTKDRIVQYETSLTPVYLKQYEVTNAINGQEFNLDYNMGDVIDAGLDNILAQFAGAIHYIIGGLSTVAANFVTDHNGDYTPVVTSSGADIIFTAAVAGTNFTGSTTITNTTGNIDGSVVTTQANVSETVDVVTITLTGTGGTAFVTVNDLNKTATWNTDLTTTASDFVTAFAANYDAAGVVLTSSGVDLIFTGKAGTGDLYAGAQISNNNPNLDGTIAHTQTYVAPVKRIDTITLTGTYGTANILCDAVTEEATFAAAPTEAWNTRDPGGENDVITELIGGEVGAQFARPKHLLDMSIYEDGDYFDIIGNLQDSLNLYSATNRKFIVNRASYNVKSRMWDLGLNELI